MDFKSGLKSGLQGLSSMDSTPDYKSRLLVRIQDAKSWLQGLTPKYRLQTPKTGLQVQTLIQVLSFSLDLESELHTPKSGFQTSSVDYRLKV